MIFTAVACLGAWLVVPEFRQVFHLPALVTVPRMSEVATGQGTDRTSVPDCSRTTELGPWTTMGNVPIDARDAWVQADFWSPARPLKEGYDELSVLFEPGLKVEVVGVAGNGWQYGPEWTREDIEYCIDKHIDDSWNIRHKRLTYISLTELCAITECR